MGFSKQEYWSGVPLPSPKKEYYSAIKKEDTKTDESQKHHTKQKKLDTKENIINFQYSQ